LNISTKFFGVCVDDKKSAAVDGPWHVQVYVITPNCS